MSAEIDRGRVRGCPEPASVIAGWHVPTRSDGSLRQRALDISPAIMNRLGTNANEMQQFDRILTDVIARTRDLEE